MIAAENPKYIKDIYFETASEFLKAISYGGELYEEFDENFIFRGHSSDKYKLLPQAQRKYMYDEIYPNSSNDKKHVMVAMSECGQIEAEAEELFNFYKKCDDAHLSVPNEKRLRESFHFPIDFRILLQHENWIAEEYQELAALAQHYGLATRLLDWTTNICVALYFASSSVLKKKATPERLTRYEWGEKVKADSEFLKTKKSLTKIEERMEIWALDKRVQFADKKLTIPLRFVRPCYYNNPNLAAQKGILTYWQVRKPLTRSKEDGQTIPDFSVLRIDSSIDTLITEYLLSNNVEEHTFMYRISLPHSTAIELYKFAKHNHCDASYLFPGYSGVARCMEEDRYMKVLVNNNKKV